MADKSLTERLNEATESNSFLAKKGDLGFASAMGKIADYQIENNIHELTKSDFAKESINEPINNAVNYVAESVGLKGAIEQEYWMGKTTNVNATNIKRGVAKNGVLSASDDLITNNDDLRQTQEEISKFRLNKEFEGVDLYSNSSLSELGLDGIVDPNRARSVLPLSALAELSNQAKNGYSPKELGRGLYNNPQARLALKDSFIDSLESNMKKNPNTYK